MIHECYFEGRVYAPIPPCRDTSELSDTCERLILRHGYTMDDPTKLFIAPTGVLHAGLVLGVMR